MAEALPLPEDDPSDSAPQVERRRRKRAKMLMSGALLDGFEEVRCHVFDLSWGGARLRLPNPPGPRTDVRLKLGNLVELQGRVAWGRGEQIGVSFQARTEAEAFALADLLPPSCY